MMREPAFRGRQPIFIGDDITDQTVFPIIPDYHGRCFSVGRPMAGTDGCFDDPTAVRAWLTRAAESLELVTEA